MSMHTVAVMGLGVRGKIHLHGLLENPDYYKLYLVQGKIYNQTFIDTRICDYVKVPDYRSDANLHNILSPTPCAYYKVVKPYKKSKEQ